MRSHFEQQTPPILSICIPAYNRPVWLKRAILSTLKSSITQQSQVEIVVSDDSTILSCRELVNELLKDWKGRWQYYANVPSLGMAANWNQCLQIATGTYVMLLHDDDYLETEAISSILQALRQNSDSAALLFGVNVVTSEQRLLKRQVVKCQQYLTPHLSLTNVLDNSSFIRFPGMVIKRGIFDRIGYFDTAVGGIADVHMWVRICQECGLLQVPKTTANYTVHDKALTMEMFTKETLVGIEKIFNEVQSQDGLPRAVLQKCKASYFSQFILAGTVRYIRIGDIQKAAETFDIFYQVDIQHSQTILKWKIVKASLGFFFFVAEVLGLTSTTTEAQEGML